MDGDPVYYDTHFWHPGGTPTGKSVDRYRGEYGFPSGHALGVAVFFGAIVYVLWTSDVSRALRWLGTLLACLLVLGVAASRIYLKVHWLSDVIGGLVGGVTYLLVVLLLIDGRLRSAKA